MKRRDLFKWIVSTCLVLVPGVKVVEPDVVKKWVNDPRVMPPSPVSGSIRSITINGQAFTVGPNGEFESVNFH